jgi:hypothetical protein
VTAEHDNKLVKVCRCVVHKDCYTVRSESHCALRVEYVQVQACIDARGHHFQHLFVSAQQLSEHRSAGSVCE